MARVRSGPAPLDSPVHIMILFIEHTIYGVLYANASISRAVADVKRIDYAHYPQH